MKKKIGLMIVAAALIVSTVLGGAFASFQSDPIRKTQNMDTSVLGLSVKADDDTSVEIKTAGLMPGESINKEMNITNSDQVEFYSRVIIHKYWTNEDGAKNNDMDASLIEIISDAKENGWIVPTFNGEEIGNEQEIVMYYTKPVKPGEETTNFIQGMRISETTGNDYTKMSGALEVTAEAIQRFDSANALMAEWGVTLEVDENGIITSIKE